MTLFVGGGSEGGREGRGEHPWDQSTPPALCPCHQPHPHACPRPAYLMDDNDGMLVSKRRSFHWRASTLAAVFKCGCCCDCR
jgi:hypothetical protein